MADRIDWPSIVQKLGSSAAAGEPSLFVFSEGARLLLLALAERLTWRATYRVDGYDYADWDMVQQFGEEAIYILAGGLKMEEITNRLDVIINLLREQPVCCADGPIPPNPPNIIRDAPNGVPQGAIENGWAVDANDWAGYNDYLCEAATALVRSLKSTLVQLESFVDRGALSTAVMLALVGAAFAIGGLVFPMALAVAGSIVSIVVSTVDIVDLWETARNELETYENELVCAIYNSQSTNDAVGAFSGIIDIRISSPIMRQVIYALPFEKGIRAIMAAEYNGEYITLTESTGATCNCGPSGGAGLLLGVNPDFTHANNYHYGNPAFLADNIPTTSLVNDGIGGDGSNSTSWWVTDGYFVRTAGNGAIGIRSWVATSNAVRFDFGRLSNSNANLVFRVYDTSGNLLFTQNFTHPTKFIRTTANPTYQFVPGTAYRLAITSSNEFPWLVSEYTAV